jgi:hypothetical protein
VTLVAGLPCETAADEKGADTAVAPITNDADLIKFFLFIPLLFKFLISMNFFYRTTVL